MMRIGLRGRTNERKQQQQAAATTDCYAAHLWLMEFKVDDGSLMHGFLDDSYLMSLLLFRSRLSLSLSFFSFRLTNWENLCKFIDKEF